MSSGPIVGSGVGAVVGGGSPVLPVVAGIVGSVVNPTDTGAVVGGGSVVKPNDTDVVVSADEVVVVSCAGDAPD